MNKRSSFKIKYSSLIFLLNIVAIFLFASNLQGQSVAELMKNFSGKSKWNEKTKTLYFKSSGEINFTDKAGDGTDLENDCKNNFWKVPRKVKTIIIGKNTKVTGAFHTYSNITIKGEDRKTSIIYGTPLQTWTDKNNPCGVDLKEWYYAQIQVFKDTAHIQNLTMLNPFSYFVRGFGPVIKMKDCDLIDNRGGHHNHSDGFCGGDGSVVENCYFECGDDVFKAYFDYKVINCTIKMVTNSVPIQLGWGNYSNGAVCNFKNLTILGSTGRYASENAIICGRKGTYKVTLNIDGLKIDNPNAVFVKLFEESMEVDGHIKNADINVKQYYGKNKGIDKLIICGSQNRKNHYKCK